MRIVRDEFSLLAVLETRTLPSAWGCAAIPQTEGRPAGSALIWRELAAEGRRWEVVKAFGAHKGLDSTRGVVDFGAWREYGARGVRTDTGKTGLTHHGDLATTVQLVLGERATNP